MSTTWDIQYLREHIAAEYPERAAALVGHANSVARSMQLFEYHKCLARDAFKELSVARGPDGIHYIQHLFGWGDQQKRFQANLQSEAIEVQSALVACGVSLNRFCTGRADKGVAAEGLLRELE